MFKLNDNQTGYEVYDDDGKYEETVKADLENFVDLLARGYKFIQKREDFNHQFYLKAKPVKNHLQEVYENLETTRYQVWLENQPTAEEELELNQSDEEIL